MVKEKIEEALEINPAQAMDKICDFIQKEIDGADAEGGVLGLSGGLDSSITAAICSKALGGENVLGIFMPEKDMTDPQNYEDVEKIVEKFNIDSKRIEISSIFEKVKNEIEFNEKAKIANANLKVRIRMILLYYYANMYDYLVVGTSNKSEIKCGYFTKYGDGAADIFPMASLYKTQTRKLAKEIGVPQNIIEKKPSAGLWEGQTDEDELGLPYSKIDRIYAGLEIGLTPSEIADAIEVQEEEVQRFIEMEENSKHKLEKPPAPSL